MGLVASLFQGQSVDKTFRGSENSLRSTNIHEGLHRFVLELFPQLGALDFPLEVVGRNEILDVREVLWIISQCVFGGFSLISTVRNLTVRSKARLTDDRTCSGEMG